MKALIRIVALIIIFGQPLKSEIILSEVLSNEPGNRVLLEWIEIYNDNPYQVDLTNYLLVEGDDTLSFPDSSNIDAYAYAVLCRRLLPDDGSDCFESHWGDSSGVWGDSDCELFAAFEIGITLTNSNGAIFLLTSDGLALDQYVWDEASDDGRSFERDNVTDPSSSWRPCYDYAGSTPGRENSAKPSANENYVLEIEPQLVSLSRSNRFITISFAVPNDTRIDLIIYDDTALKRTTLLNESDNPLGTIIWNITDDNNKPLSPGLYFVLFKTSGAINISENIPVVVSP